MDSEQYPNIAETLEKLAPFIGVWRGRGAGGYPTIDDFEYKETLIIQQGPGTSYLTYEQSTELVDADGNTIRKSHWEAGLLRPLEDGSIELANVQAGGRVEVLHGTFESFTGTTEEIRLVFLSKMIANDDRMVSSRREWSVAESKLKYSSFMATTKVGEPSIHLDATLIKEA